MAHVFLSYSRSDRQLAKRLRDDLCTGGVDIWSDRDLGLGGRWLTEISIAISRSRAMVLLATPAALASKWVMREVNAAQTLGIPVVPLLAGGARYSDLPVNLAGINGVDLADGYAESVDLVVAVLGAAECARTEAERATAEARRLLLLTADENLAVAVRKACGSIGLVVDRPCGRRDVERDMLLLNSLAIAHIAVIDNCALCDTSFVAGYVAGRGGWVICLTGDRDRRLLALPGIRFSTRGSEDVEREICAAAFLPARPPG